MRQYRFVPASTEFVLAPRVVAAWSAGWGAVFLAQLLLTRGQAVPRGLPAIAAAALEIVALLVPVGLLLRLAVGLPVARWHRGRLAWCIANLLALALAADHLDAVRALAGGRPDGVHGAGAWANAVLLSIIVPAALALVLGAWLIASRRAVRHLLDLAAVAFGCGVLALLCFIAGPVHPLDAVHPRLGRAWTYLACVVLPQGLLMAAAVLAARSRFHGRSLRGASAKE